MSCEDITDQVTCAENGCTWYDGSCHTYPKTTIPWMEYIISGVLIITFFGAAYYIKKKR